MELDPAACRTQANVLAEAGGASPVTMIRKPLLRRAREWNEAAEQLEEVQDDGEICMVGALEAGTTIVVHGRELAVIRVLVQGDRYAIHVMNDANGREEYVNLWGGKTSPVVVLR